MENNLFDLGVDNVYGRNLYYNDRGVSNKVLFFFIEVILSVLYLKKDMLVIRKWLFLNW